MSEIAWNYTVDIKLFQVSGQVPTRLDLSKVKDFSDDRLVPGFLCKAARELLGLTQQELHVLSQVSKKSLNDAENGYITIRPALTERVVNALRGAGARFLVGDGFVGVTTVATRQDVESRSRTSKKAGSLPPGGEPQGS